MKLLKLLKGFHISRFKFSKLGKKLPSFFFENLKGFPANFIINKEGLIFKVLLNFESLEVAL